MAFRSKDRPRFCTECELVCVWLVRKEKKRSEKECDFDSFAFDFYDFFLFFFFQGKCIFLVKKVS